MNKMVLKLVSSKNCYTLLEYSERMKTRTFNKPLHQIVEKKTLKLEKIQVDYVMNE